MIGLISKVYASGSAAPARRLNELDEIVVAAFDKIWPFIGLALLAMFIYGGFMWMMAEGDPQKIQKATSTLLWAFIGAVVLALIMVIMGTFESILGLSPGTLSIFKID